LLFLATLWFPLAAAVALLWVALGVSGLAALAGSAAMLVFGLWREAGIYAAAGLAGLALFFLIGRCWWRPPPSLL